MIIINNDDFGASKEINRATYLAFKNNLISSTTALVNFPVALDDACTYVRSGRIDPNAIGIHLNLTEGEPLSNKIKKNDILCQNGKFRDEKFIPDFILDRFSLDCVYGELEAQIRLFIDKFGFVPSHIDSHHHVHMKWPILKCVVDLAKKYGIESIRISRNIVKSRNYIKRFYKYFIIKYLKFNRFRIVDKFGNVREAVLQGIDSSKNYEIMVHVNLSNLNDEIVDIDNKPLKPLILKLLGEKTTTIVNYKEFKSYY